MLLCSSSVFSSSDWGYLNENYCCIWADIYEQPNFFNASSANITIYDPFGNVSVSSQMQNIDVGRFSYNYTPDKLGVWYAYVEFFEGSVKKGTASNSITIIERVLETEVLTFFVLFAVGILLAYLGQYIKNIALIAFAGIWILLVGFFRSQEIFPEYNWAVIFFCSVLSLLFIWHAVDIYTNDRKPKEIIENDD